jgi:hypothetical protein
MIFLIIHQLHTQHYLDLKIYKSKTLRRLPVGASSHPAGTATTP